ncbi:MAG: site-specific DNA-methyltransferase [Candidatus Solibacter sp.]|nr:site-specific DNA-methyltransferase [Candidatus Solibacter sp.]
MGIAQGEAIPQESSSIRERVLRDLTVEIWPIDKLIPYARNARTHTEEQVAQVAASIVEFGWTNPILIGANRIIIAGHARLLAARKLRMTEVPVIVLDHLSDTQRRALVLADNRLAMSAGWDEEMLRVELESLKADAFDLDLVGFTDDELDEILETEPGDGLTDDNDAPEPEKIAITVAGDVWVLGEHRLLCGNATVLADVEKVMAGGLADMVFTDPPYNIDYEGRTKDKLKIKNDALGSKFCEFLRDASANLLSVCKGAVYICMSSSELHTLRQAFIEAGGHWSGIIIWVKNHFTLGWGDYRHQYEPILYGWREGGTHYWCGDRDQSDTWQIKRPAANREHPTMKPVELVERALQNNSKSRDTILDPFGGSGTTIIACQKMGRQARVIELDPVYCDVTIRRWQAFSGAVARHQESGRAFDEVAAGVQQAQPVSQ